MTQRTAAGDIACPRAPVTARVRENGEPLIQDAAFRQRIAQLEVDMKALEITQYRVVSAYDGSKDGRPDPLDR